MKIGISTDVNAGLDYVNNPYDIKVLRSSVNMEGQVYIDGIDIRADEFYDKLSQVTRKEDIPSTSAPALGDIYDLLDYYVENGYTHVIHFPISFALSATGSTVKQVSEEYKDKINVTVIDTKAACFVQGFLAMNAAKMVEEGATPDQIIERSNYLIENKAFFFVVDSLDYLVKNGRLSGASGLIGNLLKIKPLLELNNEGKIVQFEKVKTSKKARQRVVELVLDYIKDEKNVKVMLFHTLALEAAEELKQLVQESRPDIEEIEIYYVTPAVGAHVGCGVAGIAAYKL